MILAPQTSVGPLIDVTIANVSLALSDLHRVEIVLDEGKHDMLNLLLAGVTEQTLSALREQPVRVSVGSRSSAPFTFYGYVREVTPTSHEWRQRMNDSPTTMIDVLALGASTVLKNENRRVFTDSYVTPVVATVLEPYRFSYEIIDPPNVLMPRLAQLGDSDWSFLLRIAEEIGFRISLHGSHLRMWNPKAALSKASLPIPLYGRQAQLVRSLVPFPGAIVGFTPTLGLVTRYGDTRKRVVTGLTSDGRAFVATAKQPTSLGTFSEANLIGYEMSTAATFDLGELHAEAAARRESWPHHATVDVIGLPEARPGRVVAIDSFSPEYDGYWYITSVHHTAINQKFSTELTLARDSMGIVPAPSPMVSARKTPVTTILNGQWVAQHLGAA